MEEAKQSELPVDIILEVLLRLPAKDLCRFRCVSKAWRALIADPVFIVAVFFGDCRREPKVRVMDMDGSVVREFEVQVLGKGDGHVLGVLRQATTARTDLICALGRRRRRTGAHGIIIDLASGRACAVSSATDSPLAALSSFGRTAQSGALKVICPVDTLTWRCNVATIVDGSSGPLRWRRRYAPPFALSCHPDKRATVNGIVYFMPWSYLGVGHIAAFDLESEEWKTINGPVSGGIQAKTCYATLTELKGRLGVIQFIGNSPFVYEPNDEHCYAIIWFLVDFNKSEWVKEYTIQMPKTWEFTKLLGVLDDGRIVLVVRELQRVQGQRHREVVVFYNPSTEAFTELRDDKALGFYHKLMLYTGSLLS